MLSQMNYRKETQPHGDELFPLSIHVFETDLQSMLMCDKEVIEV